MISLDQMIQDTIEIRTIADQNSPLKPGFLICLSPQIEQAQEWLNSTKNSDNVKIIATNNQNTRAVPRANMSLKGIGEDKTIYVYHKKPRVIALALIKMGILKFTFVKDPEYKKVKYQPEFYNNYKEELKYVFNRLEDLESKKVFASIVKHKVTGNHGYLRTSPYVEYEHPIVKPLANEWVIDCGASNGLTTFRFAEMVYPYGTAIAVEPEPQNVELINQNLETKYKPIHNRVFVENCAVSNNTGEIKFKSGKLGSSSISAEGDILVSINTLDNIINRYKLKGTGTISFDVEGYEIEALNGGKASIQRLRPKLQISAYHKHNDIIDIVSWIDENLTDYALFMGHHDSYHSETDYYAIPRELLPAN